MTATGVSLIRVVHAAIDAPAGSLAWLVSFEPASQIGAPTGAQSSPPADFFAAAVTASQGRFIASVHEYPGS